MSVVQIIAVILYELENNYSFFKHDAAFKATTTTKYCTTKSLSLSIASSGIELIAMPNLFGV